MADKIDKKEVNPLADIKYVPYPAELVIRVDRIIEAARTSSGVVQSKADLKILRMIFDLFTRYYPQDAQDLSKSVAFYKQHEKDKGIGKEGEAMVQHQLEVPEKLHAMINAVYFNQKWDKKFIQRLLTAIPELKATNARI